MTRQGSQIVVRLAELEINPGQIERYRPLLAEEIRASVETEPGVIMLHAVALKDDPAQVRLLEVYASQAAYEAHLRSRHFLNYKTQTAAMVLALRLVETEPILLCAKADGMAPPGR